MAKRVIVTALVMIAFIAGLAFLKYRQIAEAIAQGSSYQPPPEAVTTTVAKLEPWLESLRAVGTVEAVNGVVVTADLPGVVEKIAFDSGSPVHEGDVLVVLDAKTERSQLAAAVAARDLAGMTRERLRGLREKGVVSQAELDNAQAAFDQAEARVGESKATIERKTIRAPFTGILGIRQINLGQYLESGTKVVPLQSLDPIHVNFSVPQQELNHLRRGGEVRVTTSGTRPPGIAGILTAVDSLVDTGTRNVQGQATLANKEGLLRPGMFVSVEVLLGGNEQVVALPSTAINYAPYGDSVYVVEEMKGPDGKAYKGVRQQVVKLGAARGDQVAVLTGVKEGEEIVTSGVFKLRNGAAVQVNNEIQPGNEPEPKPEDS